mmetsp:Transcript_9927/g.9825  ORF Transcript_9927/g.9825 Transcript_9927/m.9825 type:complete len:85 (+) Transcript_9927:79-333(+)
MALDHYIDPTLVVRLSAEDSMQKQNFNTRDNNGRTPLLLGIDHGNMNFLQALLSSNKWLYINDDVKLTMIMERFMKDREVGQKV